MRAWPQKRVHCTALFEASFCVSRSSSFLFPPTPCRVIVRELHAENAGDRSDENGSSCDPRRGGACPFDAHAMRVSDAFLPLASCHRLRARVDPPWCVCGCLDRSEWRGEQCTDSAAQRGWQRRGTGGNGGQRGRGNREGKHRRRAPTTYASLPMHARLRSFVRGVRGRYGGGCQRRTWGQPRRTAERSKAKQREANGQRSNDTSTHTHTHTHTHKREERHSHHSSALLVRCWCFCLLRFWSFVGWPVAAAPKGPQQQQ
jgi:hypothetical protein